MPGTLKVVIKKVKFNPKYYLAKKFKPEKSRLKEGDVLNLEHYCSTEGVNVSLDGNTLTFCKEIEGADVTIIFDGTDTGGEFIRLAATYLINYEKGRQLMPLEKEMPKFTDEMKEKGQKGKATTLMFQMIKMTLRVGDRAIVRYGDVENSDARNINKMPELFDLLRNVFGVNFVLEDDGEESYTLTRMEDIRVEDVGLLEIDNHLTDEVLFTAIALWSLGKDIPAIVIETPVSWDYHIGAMVKFGRGIGMTIEDSIPVGDREIVKEWVRGGGLRTIKIGI